MNRGFKGLYAIVLLFLSLGINFVSALDFHSDAADVNILMISDNKSSTDKFVRSMITDMDVSNTKKLLPNYEEEIVYALRSKNNFRFIIFNVDRFISDGFNKIYDLEQLAQNANFLFYFMGNNSNTVEKIKTANEIFNEAWCGKYWNYKQNPYISGANRYGATNWYNSRMFNKDPHWQDHDYHINFIYEKDNDFYKGGWRKEQFYPYYYSLPNLFGNIQNSDWIYLKNHEINKGNQLRTNVENKFTNLLRLSWRNIMKYCKLAGYPIQDCLKDYEYTYATMEVNNEN